MMRPLASEASGLVPSRKMLLLQVAPLLVLVSVWSHANAELRQCHSRLQHRCNTTTSFCDVDTHNFRLKCTCLQDFYFQRDNLICDKPGDFFETCGGYKYFVVGNLYKTNPTHLPVNPKLYNHKEAAAACAKYGARLPVRFGDAPTGYGTSYSYRNTCLQPYMERLKALGHSRRLFWSAKCTNEADCSVFEARFSNDEFTHFQFQNVNRKLDISVPLCQKDLDECTAKTHNCNTPGSKCVNTIGSYICSCNQGYERTSPTMCKDIDECSRSLHNCATTRYSHCQNIPGSYACPCNHGYHPYFNQQLCVLDSTEQAFQHSCPGFGELRIPSRHDFWHPIHKNDAIRLCSQQSMELPVSSLASEVCVNSFIQRVRKLVRQHSTAVPIVFYSNSTDHHVTGNVICFVPNSLRSNKAYCTSGTCQNGGTCTQSNDGQINCKCTKDFSGYTCQHRVNKIYLSKNSWHQYPRSDNQIENEIYCDAGVFKVVKYSQNMTKVYTWDEANAICLASGMVMPPKLEWKSFTCLRQKMLQLSTTLALNLHAWTSTCSWHGSSIKCGLYYFYPSTVDGKRDGYLPNIAISSKALPRVVLCQKEYNALNCPGKNLSLFISHRKLLDRTAAHNLCNDLDMNLATGVVRQDPNFACIHAAIRSIVTQRSTNMHIWTRDCQRDGWCSLWFFDKYRLDGLRDGYRPNVHYKNDALSTHALCEKKIYNDCHGGVVCHNGGTCKSKAGFFEKCNCLWGWTGLTCNETSMDKRETVSTRSKEIIFVAGGNPFIHTYPLEDIRGECIKSHGEQLNDGIASEEDLRNVTKGHNFTVVLDDCKKDFKFKNNYDPDSCEAWSEEHRYHKVLVQNKDGEKYAKEEKGSKFPAICSRRVDYSRAVHILQLAADSRADYGRVKKVCKLFGGRVPDNELITFGHVRNFLPQLRLVNKIQGVRDLEFFTNREVNIRAAAKGTYTIDYHVVWTIKVHGSRAVVNSSELRYKPRSKASPVCHSRITKIEHTICYDRFLFRPVPHQRVLTFKQALLVCSKLYGDLPHYIESHGDCTKPFGYSKFFNRHQTAEQLAAYETTIAIRTAHDMIPVLCQQPMHVCEDYGRLFVPRRHHFVDKLSYLNARRSCLFSQAHLPYYSDKAARCVMEFMQRLQILFHLDVTPDTWWLLSNHDEDHRYKNKHVICFLSGVNGHTNDGINWDSWDTTK